MNNSVKKYLVTPEASIVQVMETIDAATKGIAFVVDENQRLIGCVTDGDIRRWLIKTADINAKVKDIMYRNPHYIYVTDDVNLKLYMEKEDITALPLVDSERRIERIVFRNEEIQKREKQLIKGLADVSVVVMAGGKGTRLYPYTKILPKPLIPIGEIPILERIMNRFVEYGVKKFYLTVNYKKGMIKSYFEELNPEYSIKYIEEEKPLGTGGSLNLIEEAFSTPIFVTNCDILIEANLMDIYRQHIKQGNDITIVSSLKNITIPYGVLEVGKNGEIEKMKEKPKMSYFVNTGMYIVNPKLIEMIPRDTFYNMPQLVEAAMEKGMKVGMYPISEAAFLDMGEIEEMKRMEEKLKV